MPRCGTIALAGRPNAGKSTLMNALVGEHLAIVSPKPQSTRLPVVGLLTKDDTQYIFTDSPGLLEPEYRLHELMRAAALGAIAGADVVVYLHPLPEAPAPPLHIAAGLPRPPRAPVLTVYTKADLMPPARRAPTAPALLVSGTTGEGLDALLAALRELLPEGPFHYDAEDLATQPMRFFAAEFVREAAFAELHEELPYSVAVEIDEYREGKIPDLYSGRRLRRTRQSKGDGHRRRRAHHQGHRPSRSPAHRRSGGSAGLSRLAREGAAALAGGRSLSQTPGVCRMSLSPDLLAILVCPKCKGPLEHRAAPAEELRCGTCRLVYAVEDDIPVMLVDEAKPY